MNCFFTGPATTLLRAFPRVEGCGVRLLMYCLEQGEEKNR